MRTVPVVLAVVAVAGVATALWPRRDPVPPDVLWFPLPGPEAGEALEVGETPEDASPDWEYGRLWVGPDDSFWDALVVVPRRSGFARLRERLADALGLEGDEVSGWFYCRCVPRSVDGPAAFAFTGLTEDEAAELQPRGRSGPRAFRDRARERIGAARFDALAGGRPDPGPAQR